MTASVVADSGVYLAVALNEKYSNQAAVLTNSWAVQDIRVAAPTLFRYEIIAVLRKSVYRSLISPDEATERQKELLASTKGINFMIDDALLTRSYELATQLNRPTAYDSQYLAVAERLGCEFWTADQKLYNATVTTLSWVKWVGNFTIPIA